MYVEGASVRKTRNGQTGALEMTARAGGREELEV